MPGAADVIGKIALLGAAGWALENLLSDAPRYSAVFGGEPLPWLPIYAVGGMTVLALSPALKGAPIMVRGATYAVALTAVELAGCQIDRDLLMSRSWDYVDGAADGCIDMGHALIWAALALLLEHVAG